MFHFSILCFSLFLSFSALAKSVSLQSVGLKYSTWLEELEVQRANISSTGNAQFMGTTLYYDYQQFENRIGYGLGAGLMFGQAHGQVSTIGSEYLATGKSWSGLLLRGTTDYRLETKITLAIGGAVFYRTNPWTKDNFDEVKSGGTTNGMTFVEARYRLGKNFETLFELGTLFVKSKTYTSLGALWKF